jgi:hypothetical protein
MENFNICLDENMVFIYIGGVSSSDPDFTKEYKFNNGEKEISYAFESVSYYSSKRPDYVIDDILTGRVDAQNLSQNTQINPDSSRKAKRLNNLVSIISFYMKYTRRKIVVIGVSHGSLIVHSAILKIKGIYRPIEQLFKIFNERIIVLTLGSPKYLPLSLLSDKIRDYISFGNVYNFYNTKDGIYSVLNSIRKLGFNSLSYLKFPELKDEFNDESPNYVNIEPLLCLTNTNIPKYKYDDHNHLFFVKNTENLKYFKDNSSEEIYIIQNLCKNTLNIVFFHSILFHFFPIFKNKLHILHYMRNIMSTDRSTEDNDSSINEILNRNVFVPSIDILLLPEQTGGKIKKVKKVKKYLKK